MYKSLCPPLGLTGSIVRKDPSSNSCFPIVEIPAGIYIGQVVCSNCDQAVELFGSRFIPGCKRLGDDVYNTTHCIGTIYGGRTALNDFNSVNLGWGNGYIRGKMSSIGVIDPVAIQDNQYLLEGAATYDEIALRTKRAPCLYFNAWYIAQQVIYTVNGCV